MSNQHVYIEDPTLPPGPDGLGVCVACGLPERNDRHPSALAAQAWTKAQAAHLARYDHEVVVPPS